MIINACQLRQAPMVVACGEGRSLRTCLQIDEARKSATKNIHKLSLHYHMFIVSSTLKSAGAGGFVDNSPVASGSGAFLSLE